MGIPDLSKLDSPLGPLRNKLFVTIGSTDYEPGFGFTCHVVAPASGGSLTYRCLDGDADLTETGLAAGDFPNVAGVAVAVRIVRGSSTVTQIAVGRP